MQSFCEPEVQSLVLPEVEASRSPLSARCTELGTQQGMEVGMVRAASGRFLVGLDKLDHPQFSFLKTVLGQIYPLNQSKLGPNRAPVLLVCRGRAIWCHLGRKEQAEPSTAWAVLEVVCFLVPFRQAGRVPSSDTGRDLSIR